MFEGKFREKQPKRSDVFIDALAVLLESMLYASHEIKPLLQLSRKF